MKRHMIAVEGAAIADTFGPVTALTYLDALRVHVSAAPTTSEYLTLTLDAREGAVYDTVLYRIDLSAASTADVLWVETVKLLPGDALRLTYTNTDGRTIGAVYELR